MEDTIMIKTRGLAYLCLIFFVYSLSSFAQKDSSVINRLSKKADVILIGKVNQKESSWNASNTRIYTMTTVEVDEYLKGMGNGNSIEIITPGGEVGDVGELYTHMPRFEDNEEVLVFLKKDQKNNEFKVLNGEDGKINIISDEKTNEKVTNSNMRIKDLKLQIKNSLNEQ